MIDPNTGEWVDDPTQQDGGQPAPYDDNAHNQIKQPDDSNTQRPDPQGVTSQPAPLNEAYFKDATKGDGGYDPNVYREYLKDPTQSWADRLVNKENLRANNEVGSEYHDNGQGGYLTPPASKLLGSPSGAGGSGSGGSSSGSSGSGGGGNRQDEIYGVLKGLFPGGGFNQDIVNRRLDSVRSSLDAGRKSSMANNEAYLADRGLIGSGPQATAAGNLDSRLFGQYTSAANDAYATEEQNADARMAKALELATGMSESEAQNQIDWFKANNDLTLGQGQLALGNKNADISKLLGLGQLSLGQGNLNVANKNASTGSYTAQTNYDIATKQLEQAHRDLDEAIRSHKADEQIAAQQKVDELNQLLSNGTHN